MSESTPIQAEAPLDGIGPVSSATTELVTEDPQSKRIYRSPFVTEADLDRWSVDELLHPEKIEAKLSRIQDPLHREAMRKKANEQKAHILELGRNFSGTLLDSVKEILDGTSVQQIIADATSTFELVPRQLAQFTAFDRRIPDVIEGSLARIVGPDLGIVQEAATHLAILPAIPKMPLSLPNIIENFNTAKLATSAMLGMTPSDHLASIYSNTAMSVLSSIEDILSKSPWPNFIPSLEEREYILYQAPSQKRVIEEEIDPNSLIGQALMLIKACLEEWCLLPRHQQHPSPCRFGVKVIGQAILHIRASDGINKGRIAGITVGGGRWRLNVFEDAPPELQANSDSQGFIAHIFEQLRLFGDPVQTPQREMKALSAKIEISDNPNELSEKIYPQSPDDERLIAATMNTKYRTIIALTNQGLSPVRIADKLRQSREQINSDKQRIKKNANLACLMIVKSSKRKSA